ncbi:uncharacterized protein isoform X3 [Rhodnius prolixus]|uniref:uncharacterized protein isoform X3 n=1 Tax=Rhodnius prolixus TaxID=13249 RepID=UPI003D188F27
MKKLIVEETYPRNDIGKNMIYNKMKSHYRRVSSAKAKVDSNLPRPPKIVLPLSREICDVVDRNYYPYNHFPKHRRCLKVNSFITKKKKFSIYKLLKIVLKIENITNQQDLIVEVIELENHEFLFKPLILSTNTESKLKTLGSVYHPPVRTPRRTKSRESNRLKQEETNQSGNESNNLAEVDDTNETKELEEQRTVIENIPVVTKKEMFAQTEHFQKQSLSYRPLDPSSLHFLKDITDDILRKGVYTDDSLEAKAMENELDRLRDEVGMQRPGLRNSVHSDEEALEALDSLQLDPTFKQEIINSLRLHNAENYHSTIIESEIYNLPLSPKPLEITEKQNSLEIVQPSSLEEQLLLTVNNVIDNKEEEQEDEVVEVTSTTSEVSDIEEIEFDNTNFVDSFEDEEQEDNEENDNHSATIKSITQSLCAVKSKADSHNGNSEEVEDKNSEGVLDSENNQERSVISEIRESDDKEEIESVMELKTIKTEEISQEKEDEGIKTNTKSIDDYSSMKTDVKTEIPSDLEFGTEDTAEEEEEEEVDVDKSENEEKLSKTKELAGSESSSDLSSIHTEASDN